MGYYCRFKDRIPAEFMADIKHQSILAYSFSFTFISKNSGL